MNETSHSARRRLWFDISTLTRCPVQPTGIPRVLLALTRELQALPGLDAVFCVIDERGHLTRVAPDSILARFRRPDVGVPRVARSFATRLACLWRSHAPEILTPTCASDLGPEDVLVSLGGGWTSDPEGRVYRRLKRRTGARIALVLYDLIPLRFPRFFPPIVDRVFTPWFHAMAPLLDLGLAISRQTRADFEEHCARSRLPCPPIEILRLGEDFEEASGKNDGRGSCPLSQVPRPFVLSVGTVEIRKNHRLLVEVWRRLLQVHDPRRVPTLVVAGSRGWLTEDLHQDLAADPLVRGHVRFLHDVRDADLARLYGACLWTMYPSRYEGWGLPVCESLGRGKICIASNAASIPEIAAALTDLHDPDDVRECQNLVERYLFDVDMRQRREREIRENYRRTRWRDTARALVGHIQARHMAGRAA